MAKRSKVYPVRVPPLPLRPGRAPLSPRTRAVFAAGLAAALAALVAGGILLARSSPPPRRVVTLPPADRGASPALLRAAAAVGFRPRTAPGVGSVEGLPAGAARPVADGLLPVGAPAPGFDLRTPTGARVSLRSLRGRAVLLEFFATWCPHCAAEAPHLKALEARFPRRRAAFVAIDGNGGDAPSVFAFHVWFGLPFPALLDPGGGPPATFPDHGAPGPVTRSYGVGSYPTFYVLDPRGRVAWRSIGEQPDALLERELRRALPGAAG
ncbi:MAG TPA: TlpA disulfide reductase family protein [Gaiellaceae bacterium]|nr:TlpA disulfide reductase family protein [Gaiellaceae bacterium]